MDTIHQGTVALMAFMLAVFSLSLSWYLPVQEASYAFALLALLWFLALIVFSCGILALLTTFYLNEGSDKLQQSIIFGYRFVIVAACLCPFLMLWLL